MGTVNLNKEEPQLGWDVNGLARAYRVSPGLIRLEILRGNLKVARIGKRIVIPIESVEAWLGTASKQEGDNRERA